MKKISFTILTILMFTTSGLLAQVDLGVMNGIHITNADYEPNEPFSKKYFAIPQFGLYVKYRLTDNLALQFSPSVSANKIESSQLFYDIEITSGIVDLPLLISYEFDLGMFKPYVFAGPNIGIITNPKLTTYFSGKNEEDISNDVADLVYSIKGGLGLELEFEAFSFFGQAYYSYGLNDLYTPPNGVTFPEDVYLRSIGLQAGISFPISGNTK